MPKFKVGDQVKYINGDAFSSGNYIEVVRDWDFPYDQGGKVKVTKNTHTHEDEIQLVDPEYKTWGDMTDEEKGALLLAHHEGKTIEYLTPNKLTWKACLGNKPSWHIKDIYRIKPEPVSETVCLTGGDFGKGKSVAYSFRQNGHIGKCLESHRITFDIVDGEPDCDSINMEKL